MKQQKTSSSSATISSEFYHDWVRLRRAPAQILCARWQRRSRRGRQHCQRAKTLEKLTVSRSTFGFVWSNCAEHFPGWWALAACFPVRLLSGSSSENVEFEPFGEQAIATKSPNRFSNANWID